MSSRAWALLATSLVARLPLAMLGIGLLVDAQAVTGSFSAAGIVAGAYAVWVGAGGPLLGRIVDRRGQTLVVVASAAVATLLLAAVAALPEDAPLFLLAALAAGSASRRRRSGVGVRTLLPEVLAGGASVRSVRDRVVGARATFVAGPPIVLAVGAVASTGAALALAGAVLLAGAFAFAASPTSRAWRPPRSVSRPRGGTLRSPSMRVLVVVLTAVGVLFGAVEVGATATAVAAGSAAGAAPLLACWVRARSSEGSSRRGSAAARTPAGLALAAGADLSATPRWPPRAAVAPRSPRSCSSPAPRSLPPTRASTRWSTPPRPRAP